MAWKLVGGKVKTLTVMLRTVAELIWAVTELRAAALIRKAPVPRVRRSDQAPSVAAMAVASVPPAAPVERSTSAPGWAKPLMMIEDASTLALFAGLVITGGSGIGKE